MLKTYRDICAHQMYRRYVQKDIPYTETEAMKYGTDVHSALERRIGSGRPLPEHFQQFESFCAAYDGRKPAVEQRLGVTKDGKSCDYWDRHVWGRGRVDVAIVNGTTAYLADHKTGREREDPFELEIQAVLLHAKHPRLTKIVGQYLWLKEMKCGQLHDLSDTQATWTEINHLMQQIESCRQQGLWEKRKGPLCRFCDVLDCEYNSKPQGNGHG